MKVLKNFDDFVNEGKSELTTKQKKLPKALQDSILKKKGKKTSKEDDKDEKEEKPSKSKKGLTAKQKKLPLALQKSILKKTKVIQ
jgi:hypothetical protein